MCRPGDFDVYTSDDVHIGKVAKEWGGYIQETRTEADNFGIEFPIDLDIKCKTVILGALFLIVSVFFRRLSMGRLIPESKMKVFFQKFNVNMYFVLC